MRLSWRERALDDVENLKDYIASDNTFYAEVFINRIIDVAEKLINIQKWGESYQSMVTIISEKFYTEIIELYMR